nr:hypothetical protein CFP56_24316 [Quercus suber]
MSVTISSLKAVSSSLFPENSVGNRSACREIWRNHEKGARRSQQSRMTLSVTYHVNLVYTTSRRDTSTGVLREASDFRNPWTIAALMSQHVPFCCLGRWNCVASGGRGSIPQGKESGIKTSIGVASSKLPDRHASELSSKSNMANVSWAPWVHKLNSTGDIR